ncbi:hypothetical protein C2S51_037401 [Perilla frutescens var. frutescens]|nr:hypothetical protein C2S51_037401 [Perilla frutescens var. frutescens]
MVYIDTAQPQPPDPRVLRKLIMVASIAAGVQFGWALQFSLLTPYTQFLGLSHQLVSIVWLCGPISGLVVQPIVGHYSDRCTSPFGRRRPYIVAGTVLLSLGVLLIGFAADIGRNLGDSLERGVLKCRAASIFVLGFWLLDIANNMIQGPCRALLADISGPSDALVTIGNALFACFMAVGNIMGFAAGSFGRIYMIFPFTRTDACHINCANIKTCFLLSVILTSLIVVMVVVFIKEERLDPLCLAYLNAGSSGVEDSPPSFLMQIVLALRDTSRPIRILYAVTALNWVGFFPFLLYDTDWMGKEVYGGTPTGDPAEVNLYSQGIRVGAMGLMVYVITMGCFSLVMETMARVLGDVRRLWSGGNFVLALCMLLTVVISAMAERAREAAAVASGSSLVQPPVGVKVSCFALFGLLGIPQAVTYTIPFALASIYSKDGSNGQGLALGLLNLAIVIPQMGVALISGPLDAVFGGSNLPAFVLGGTAAAVGGIAALKLPLS